MTAESKQKHRSAARWATLFGVALGLICHLLPHDYRAACATLAHACSGGGF